MAISQRRFGVEIECGTELDETYGCEKIETCVSHAGKVVRRAVDSVDCDGTCAEVRTEILRGEVGFKRLERILKFLREDGKAFVTQRDGMHVHHDAPEFADNWDNTERLLRAWHINEPHIVKMLPDRRLAQGKLNYRSKPAKYSGSGWSLDQLRDAISRDKEHTSHYRLPTSVGHTFHRNLLNISSLPYHGTVEWRALEGTLDYERARAWIEFGQRFMDWVLTHDKKWTCTSLAMLFSTLEVPADQQKVLRNAGRHDPTFRGTQDVVW